MGGADGVSIVQLLGVESKTEGSLDTGAESLSVTQSNDTRVVDLSLDKGSSIKVDLGADLEANTAVSGLGVIDSLGTRLDVAVDAVVVRGGEGAEVVEAVEGDGVLRRVVAESGGVAGHLALGDVVGGLDTGKETVASQNGVGGEGRALWGV